MGYRKQKYITITDEQVAFIKANCDVMTISEMAEVLGLSFGKVYQNMKVLKIKKKKLCYNATANPERKKPIKQKIKREAKVIDFDRDGFFDETKWKKIMKF